MTKKITDSSKDSTPHENLNWGVMVGLPAASVVGGQAALAKVHHDMNKDLQFTEFPKDYLTNPKSEPVLSPNEQTYKQLRQYAEKHHGIPRSLENELLHPSSSGYSPWPEEKLMVAPHGSPEIVSHELGHATMRNPGIFNKIRRGSLIPQMILARGKIAPLVGNVGASLGYATDTAPLTYGAAGLSALGNAAMVGEEALASIKGYNMLKALGKNPRANRYLWPLATYAAGATMNAGLPAYLAYKQYHNNALKEEAAMQKESSFSDAYDVGVSMAYEELQKFATAAGGKMPFKSKAQQRFMFAAENRGEVPKGTAERWAKHTPDIKALPERKKTAAEIADVVIEKVASENSR